MWYLLGLIALPVFLVRQTCTCVQLLEACKKLVAYDVSLRRGQVQSV